MKKVIFKGAGTALITPFNENNVNLNALKNLLNFQINQKIDSLIILRNNR